MENRHLALGEAIIDGFDPIVRLVVDGLTSKHSRRSYGKSIADFLDWRAFKGNPVLSRALVQAYKRELQDSGLAPNTINLKITAIRKLAKEASENGLLSHETSLSITDVEGVRTSGVRSGNWLTLVEAQKFMDTPDVTTDIGRRNRAVIAVMLGGGLRRSEVASLSGRHISTRDEHAVIVDLVGKGNKIRTVSIPDWVKNAIGIWVASASFQDINVLKTGTLFRTINKAGKISRNPLTETAIYDIVREVGILSGLDVAPHDLRRTYAKLARSGGSALEQIQISLGHSSILTTQRYLGSSQDINDAPGDHIALHL